MPQPTSPNRAHGLAFSCKQRGLCPSCGARRSHETAAHCGQVLPEVPYRQWTLSVPFALHWSLVKHPGLLRRAHQAMAEADGAEARGEREASWGAVAFTQYFGSALQMTPHLHLLVPEGLWDAEARFVALPAPEADEVGGVLRRVLRQLLEDFEETAEE